MILKPIPAMTPRSRLANGRAASLCKRASMPFGRLKDRLDPAQEWRKKPRRKSARGPVLPTPTPRRRKRASARGPLSNMPQEKDGQTAHRPFSWTKTFVTLVAGFALGYAAALLIHRSAV